MGAKDALVSFAGGLVMTLVLVTVVPVIVDTVVERYVSEFVGDSSFLMLSSDVIVNLVVWAVDRRLHPPGNTGHRAGGGQDHPDKKIQEDRGKILTP